MTHDKRRTRKPGPEDKEESIRAVLRELEEASSAPWTEEDQAAFDNLPELPPLEENRD